MKRKRRHRKTESSKTQPRYNFFSSESDAQRRILLLEQTTKLDSTFAKAWNDLGVHLSRQGKTEQVKLNKAFALHLEFIFAQAVRVWREGVEKSRGLRKVAGRQALVNNLLGFLERSGMSVEARLLRNAEAEAGILD